MKRRLMRPSAAFFPLALMVSALFGDKTTTMALYLMWSVLQITTLCAPVAFCNAAAREPGVRRVGRRFWGGIMQCLLGGALLFVPLACSPARPGISITVAVSAFLIIIEQMFEERMFALGRKVDGTLLSLIANAFLLIGLMLDAGSAVKAPEVYSKLLGKTTEFANFYLLCGCGVAVLISALLTFVMAGGKGFTPFPVNCGHGPKALLQVLLYHTAVNIAGQAPDTGIALRHVLFGMILWQLSRTVCRRTQRESKPLDWLLTVITAVFAVLACLHPAFLPYAICCGAALICAMAIYLAPSVRLYVCAGAALSILTLAYFHPMPYLF